MKTGENSIAGVFWEFIIPNVNHIVDIASRSSYKGNGSGLARLKDALGPNTGPAPTRRHSGVS
jgi:hypothetical protein